MVLMKVLAQYLWKFQKLASRLMIEILLIVSIFTGAIFNCIGVKKDDNSTLLLLLMQSSGQIENPEFTYQLSTQLLYDYGPLFTGKSGQVNFQQISDISAVYLNKSVVDSSIPNSNVFILDGNSGSLMYLKTSKFWEIYKDDALKQSKGISVSSNGKIVILKENGNLNFCFSYDQSVITKSSPCTEVIGNYNAIESSDKLLYAATDLAVYRLEPDTGSIIVENKDYKKIRSLTIGSKGLIIVYFGGKNVALVNHNNLSYIHYKFNIRLPYKDGNLTPIINISDISESVLGNYFVVDDAYGLLGLLGPDLKPITFWQFPTMPLPFLRLLHKKKVNIEPIIGILYISTANGLNVYRISRDDQIALPNKKTQLELPDAAVRIRDKILKNPSFIAEALQNNPSVDLFKIPSIKQIIDEELNKL